MGFSHAQPHPEDSATLLQQLGVPWMWAHTVGLKPSLLSVSPKPGAHKRAGPWRGMSQGREWASALPHFWKAFLPKQTREYCSGHSFSQCLRQAR